MNDIYDEINKAVFANPEAAINWGWSYNATAGKWQSVYKLSSNTADRDRNKGRTALFANGMIHDADGTTKGFCDLFAELNGMTTTAAREQLCKIYGIKYDGGQCMVKDTDKLKAAFEMAAQKLNTRADLIEAIKTRRNMNDAEIMALKIGLADRETLTAINDQMQFKFSERQIETAASSKSIVVLPYWSRGRIVSAILYNTKPAEKMPKYEYCGGFPKQYYPLAIEGGICPINTRGNMYVVEGVFDAYNAQLKGFYAVGLLGVSMSDTARDLIAQHASRYGESGARVIFALDNDQSGTRGKIEAARKLAAAGCNSFVVFNNESAEKDVDEAIKHGTAEEWLNRQTSAMLFEVLQLVRNTPPAAGKLPAKEWLSLVEGLQTITNIYPDSMAANRDEIEAIFLERYGRRVDAGDLIELHNAKERAKHIASLENAVEKAKADNDTQTLRKVYTELSAAYETTSEADINQPINVQSFLNEMSAVSSLTLPFWYKEPKTGWVERISMPTRGYTLFAAKTGHFKSTFCENLCRRFAFGEKETGFEPVDGDILFYTYEELPVDIARRMINQLAANIPFVDEVGKHSNVIRKERERAIDKACCNYLNGGKNPIDLNEKLLADEVANFFSVFDKRLKIRNANNMTAEKLCTDIRRYNMTRRIGAIFIDYVQRMPSALALRSNISKTTELSAVAFQLDNLAKEISTPIICAAQYNREMVNPSEMVNDIIADCSVLEKTASMVVGQWNYREAPRESKTIDKVTPRVSAVADTMANVYDLTPIYSKVTKTRVGSKGVETLFAYDAKTSRLYQADGAIYFPNEAPANGASKPLNYEWLAMTGIKDLPIQIQADEAKKAAKRATAKANRAATGIDDEI